MKLKKIAVFECYELNINKDFFISKNEVLYGKEKSLRLYYLCYLTYLNILKINYKMDIEDNKEILKKLILKLEFFENRLQKFWGFTPDARFHTYWKHSKSCKCNSSTINSMQNRNYNLNCKIHSVLFN